MTKKTDFNCYLIGENSLLIQCADILLKKGHRILGIISPLPKIISWSQENNIPCYETLKMAETVCLEQPADYLFSIVNSQILTPRFLNSFRKFAINYHDAPLPKYAGVNATSWAILNGEKKHGVTWHVINDLIDGGDILKQTTFNISKDETAFSLNLKCYEKAILAFEELTEELSSNSFMRITQDLKDRTYYGANKKPSGNGLIDWHKSAEEIYRLYRALNFGKYINPFSTCKFILKNEIFIVEKLEKLLTKSGHLPGTLIEVLDSEWQITTGTYDIRITKIKKLQGENFSLRQVAKAHKLSTNCHLDSTGLDVKQFEKISSDLCKYESFWVKLLDKFKAVRLPLSSFTTKKDYKNKNTFISEISFSNVITDKWLEKLTCQTDFTTVLLTICLIYIYRLNNQENISVFLSYPELNKLPLKIYHFIQNQTPFNVKLNSDVDFITSLQIVKDNFLRIMHSKSYLTDITARYPSLQEKIQRNTIVIIISNKEAIDISQDKDKSAPLVIHISNRDKKIALFSNLKNSNHSYFFIKTIHGHLKTLALAIKHNPNGQIKNFPLLTDRENKKILNTWNNTEQYYRKDETLCDLFYKQVKKTPHHTALLYQDKCLTYWQLHIKSNRLARYLQENNIAPGSLVVINMVRSIEMIIAIMGVLKTGAAYIPVDSSTPLINLKKIVIDSKASLLLTNEFLFKINKEISTKLPTIQFEKLGKILKKYSAENIYVNNFGPEDIAYIIYTSGTTASPKGVMIKHRSVINLIIAQIRVLSLSSTSRILQFSSIGFDASIWEIFSTLSVGATLIMSSQEKILAGEFLAEFINKNKINTITLPPSILATLPCSRKTSALKVIVTAGEPCLYAVAKKWSQRVPHFINAYGPTETTVCATTAVITKDFRFSPPIGKPIANFKTYVLDAFDQPVPIGVVGELYIGGDGIAAGYVNNKKLTNERFIVNRFDKTRTTKLYKTGDLVRWLPNGNLDYIGRLDKQIKLRGFRIELECIESEILHFAGIINCIVMTHTDKNSQKLIAYLTVNDKFLSIDNLREFLKKNLPNYMIPSLYILLDNFPLTINGKIDKKALEFINVHQRIANTSFEPPNNLIEIKLQAIWSNLLEIKEIGINDNFFNLGGDSILLTKLMMELMTLFDYNLILTDFLENPTIYFLGKIISTDFKIKNKTTPLMLRDINLQPKIQLLRNSNTYQNDNFKSILLTGVTGYLGNYLLKNLCKLTNSTIYCLIRNDNNQAAQTRLANCLQNLGIDASSTNRIIPLHGDLSKPILGLSENCFTFLAKNIDVIYHNGANVNHLFSYEKLRACNVLSTVELLKLAALVKPKKFHYISTLSALLDNLSEDGSITESFISPQSIPKILMNGYNQTKWVSEVLIAQAQQRGLLANIYRLGWILGSENLNNLYYESNHLSILLRGCLQMGYAPAWDMKLNMLPVEFVSQLIIKVSLGFENSNKIFNIVNPNCITWIDLIHYAQYCGHKIILVPPEVWRDKHLKKIDESNVLCHIFAIYSDKSSYLYQEHINKSCQAIDFNTQNMIKKYHLEWPINSTFLLKYYFPFLQSDNLFQPA